ncbi:MAG: HD family phosphohydrolase [Thermoguttaceae bacterium]
MATGGQKRTRSERVAALELPPGQWERAWISLRRRDVLARIGLALAAAVAMCCAIHAWDPPFSYRMGHVPARDIMARLPFTQAKPQETQQKQQQARNGVRWIFSRDPKPLEQLGASLYLAVVQLTTPATLTEATRPLWRKFQPLPAAGASSAAGPRTDEKAFQAFRAALTGTENLARFQRDLAAALTPFEQRGLLDLKPDKGGEQPRLGNPEEILVHAAGQAEPLEVVTVADVLLGDGAAIHRSLQEHFQSRDVADRVFAWLWPQLPAAVTLKQEQQDQEATRRAQDEAAAAVPSAVHTFPVGSSVALAEHPLDAEQIELLKLEYAAYLAHRPAALRLARTAAVLFLLFALLMLCGIHMRYRQRGPLASLGRLSVILVLALATVVLARWAALDPWRAELAPLLLFGMTMAIVYRQELALLMSGILAWVVTLAVGHGLPEYILLLGTLTAAVVTLGQIRSRSKLIYVGLAAGGVAFVLGVVLSVINSQSLDAALFRDAAWTGMWAVAAGFIMTGLLPFIEQGFGVLTDLSLLELGDVTHPLLQELVRRAPSTYSHSMTVGSIAEAAAESIGARGLLARVGAYFHDIGKMLKPGYFIENQGSETSRHEALVPAMSTLVIIAHIKDGSDLARQHHLPQPIIDLIQQHHGTTLVEYFYDRAHQKGGDANGNEVDESIFRYPGPRPQTKEAAVLMLADAVESASRTLVDPTPARIESLVRGLAEHRLHGGQFDESGLTLRELRTIERSMVMSLTAIYHGRLKYPEPRTAWEKKTPA